MTSRSVESRPEALGVSPETSKNEGDLFETAFASINGEGRLLLQNLDGSIRHDPPFLLAFDCRGRALDQAIRRVSTFAFALAAIIATLVLVGAAPRLIGIIALFWVSAACSARLFARRRRREHGSFIIDFEREMLGARYVDGRLEQLAFDKTVALRVSSSFDSQAPYWLLCAPVRHTPIRLAHGRAEDLRSILKLFRTYNYDVNRSVIDAEER